MKSLLDSKKIREVRASIKFYGCGCIGGRQRRSNADAGEQVEGRALANLITFFCAHLPCATPHNLQPTQCGYSQHLSLAFSISKFLWVETKKKEMQTVLIYNFFGVRMLEYNMRSYNIKYIQCNRR
jgi:hypothetical protein